METNKTKKLYTVPEVAKVTDIPISALKRWIKSGDIGIIKSGRRSYLSLDALDAFINKASAVR